MFEDTITGSKVKYYINVCRPLTPVNIDNACGTFAAICRTKLDGNSVRNLDICEFEQFNVLDMK